MITLQKVRRDAPWNWLKAGWADMMRAPGVSLSYGLVFVGIGALITGGLWALNLGAVAPVALSGFALIAPALAIGIYQVSRALERGEQPRFGDIISQFPERITQIAFLSLLLLLLLMAWLEIAQFMFVIIAPGTPLSPGAFLEFSLSEPAGMTLLVLGTIVGSALAGVAFAISVIAFPMLVDQDVDAVTALVASVTAVRRQPFVMFTWAWLIGFMTVAGTAFFLIGLALVFPWLAHASWHAYKEFAPSPSASSSASGG
tara:strand:+ start:1308 stop:2081 length:774 start_codon:yes stop_codon:yes gene_type:complete